MVTSSSSTKQHHQKVILTSIAVGAAGVLGYFGWQFYQKKKRAKSGVTNYSDLDSLLKPAPSSRADSLPDLPGPSNDAIVRFKPRLSSSNPSSTFPAADAPAGASDFPLKKGSKGEKVRLLQRALIAKYGKSILPKYGADGSFGSETITALRKAGLSSSVDESTFNVLTQGVQSDGASLGTDLYKATTNKDFSAIIAGLKKMNTTSDYTAASKVFKSYRIDGVRQTIVNALLHTFSSDEEQQQIKFEFLRIGLQFNGNQWSLSGLGGLPIITIRPAIIWTNTRNRLNVPARVVLGNEVTKRLDYTLFENQGQYFLVPTSCVRYI